MSDIDSVRKLTDDRSELIRSIEIKRASLSNLKQQYTDKLTEVQARYNVKSPEELNELSNRTKQELSKSTADLTQAVQLFNAGNYQAVVKLLTPQDADSQ